MSNAVRNVIITTDTPEDAIRLIEVMSADLGRIIETLGACCQDIRGIFDPLILDLNTQLAASYARALAASNKGGAA